MELPYKDKYGHEYFLIPELCLYDAYDSINGKNRNIIAIQLFLKEDNDIEAYATLTVNLGEYIGVKNCAYIDTNNLGDDILEWLEEIKAGHRTSFTKHSGFCEYPLFEFDEKFLLSIDDNNCYNHYNDDYNEYMLPFYDNDEIDITEE